MGFNRVSINHLITRRTVMLTAGAAATSTGLGTAWAQAPGANPHQAIYMYKGADRDQRLIERAKAEGMVSLYTSLAPTEAGPLTEAFEKKYGVKVNLWRAISEAVVQRALTEGRSRRHTADVIETNAPEMEALAREQLLGEFYSPHFADLPPAAIPKHGMWVSDRFNFFVVAFNTKKFKAEDMPKTYEGFLDPKWKGRIAMEATDAEWMGMVVKTWGEARGMAFFRKLSEMKPDMRKGHVLLSQLISSGEVDVGLTAYQSNAESFKRRGAPIDWVAVQPVIARPQAVGLLRQAPRPHAALLFADFLLSPEAQTLLASMGRNPVSRAVKSDTSNIPYVMSDPVVLLEENEKWQQLWEKLFLGK